MFYVAFGKNLRAAWSVESQWTRLLGRIFVASVVILALVVIVGGASALQDRWLIPLFFLVPVYLGAKLDLAGVETAVASRRFSVIVLAIMVAIPLILGTRPFLGSLGLDGKQNVPYGPAVTAILASGNDRPSIIVAGDQHLAGNIRLHDGGIPVALSGYEAFEAPYAFDANNPRWRSGATGAARRLPTCRATFANGSTGQAAGGGGAGSGDALSLRPQGRGLSLQLCVDLSSGHGRAALTDAVNPPQGRWNRTGSVPDSCAASISSNSGMATRKTRPSSSVIIRADGRKPIGSPSS